MSLGLMGIGLENLAVILILLAAFAYAGWKFYQLCARKGGCSGCAGGSCGAPSKEKQSNSSDQKPSEASSSPALDRKESQE